MNTRFCRAARKWLSGLVAGLLLVSQIATAAQACTLSVAGGVPASHVQVMQDDCDSISMDAAACQVRCLTQDPSVASTEQPPNVFVASAPAEHATIALAATQCLSKSASTARWPSGPPLRILHCSYQT